MNTAAHIFTAPKRRLCYNNAISTPAPRRTTSINHTNAQPLGNVNNDDRLYVCLTLQGSKIAELSLIGVRSLSDIIAQLRFLAAKYRGLAQMYIRNITAGWSTRRPLMLYA